MNSRATETTSPASADFGLRTFEVTLSESCVIEVTVAQRTAEACPGEIHPPDELLISGQVVINQQLRAALAPLLDAVARAELDAQHI